MPVLRIEYSVPDFDEWKELFDSDPADRKSSGIRRYQILRSVEDPNYVMIDLEFGDVAAAEAFHASVRKIWEGPASALVRNPRARIANRVEVKEL